MTKLTKDQFISTKRYGKNQLMLLNLYNWLITHPRQTALVITRKDHITISYDPILGVLEETVIPTALKGIDWTKENNGTNKV